MAPEVLGEFMEQRKHWVQNLAHVSGASTSAWLLTEVMWDSWTHAPRQSATNGGRQSEDSAILI